MASGLNLKVAQIEPKSDSKSGTVSTETGGAIRPKQVAQIEPYYPQGPGEIKSMIWELDKGIYEKTFWAYDLNSKEFHEFDLSLSNPSASRSIRQKKDWFLGFSTHILKENRFISNVTRDNYRFGIFDSLGNRIDSFAPWVKEKEVNPETGYLLLGLNQG